MPKVFISYRRDDSAGITGRLDDRLVQHFGRDCVFMDVDTIRPGVDFREHLTNAVQGCDVLLVVIGKKWMGTRRGGVRRIDDPTDFVRIEVEAALLRRIPVVPVLAESASMPQADMLPDSLQALIYRQAVIVDVGRDFHAHVDRLIRGIEHVVNEKLVSHEQSTDSGGSAVPMDATTNRSTPLTASTEDIAHRAVIPPHEAEPSTDVSVALTGGETAADVQPPAEAEQTPGDPDPKSVDPNDPAPAPKHGVRPRRWRVNRRIAGIGITLLIIAVIVFLGILLWKGRHVPGRGEAIAVPVIQTGPS